MPARGIGYNPTLLNQNTNTNTLPVNQSNDLYNDWTLEGYNTAYGSGGNNERFEGENKIFQNMDQQGNYRPPNTFMPSGIGSFYNDPSFQHEGSVQGPAVYPASNDLDANWSNINRGVDKGNIDNKGFSLSPVLSFLKGVVPKMDPRQKALRDFYGYDNMGRVPPGGLMAGYNPVSGGLLNTVTGGKFGDPTNYGLGRAYDKRMSRIEKTLGSKYGLNEAQIQDIYAGDLKDEEQYNTQLIQRLRDLKAAKAAEAAMLQGVTEGQGGTQITDGSNTGDQQWITKKGGSYQGGADQGTKGSWTPGGTYSGGAPQHNPHRDTPSGNYGAAQGSKGSWTPGGSYKEGGRIGYERGRVVNPGGYAGDEVLEEFEDENTLDFMRDQGVPHSEMAEISPFEARIQELVDTGMSWQEAYTIAAQEFGMAEGQEDSFSEEGIASLV